jgi:hypothetical protein
MSAALLTFILVAISVDPRLEEPLRLLAEVRHANGDLVATEYVQRARDPRITMVVWDLPPGQSALHNAATRMITVAPSALSEDPRILATILAHELRHSLDLEAVDRGELGPDCMLLEARAFEAQVIVARAFWPDEVPAGTSVEREVAGWVGTYENGGLAAMLDRLDRAAVYQAACASWHAPT